MRAGTRAEGASETRRAPVLGRGLPLVRPRLGAAAGRRSRRVPLRLLERARPKDVRELPPPPLDDEPVSRLVRRAHTRVRGRQLRRLPRRYLRGRVALAADASPLPG